MIVNFLLLALLGFQSTISPAFENNFETVKMYINERNQLYFINKQSIVISTDKKYKLRLSSARNGQYSVVPPSKFQRRRNISFDFAAQ